MALNSNIDRRRLLRLAGLAGLGVAASPLLAACGDNEPVKQNTAVAKTLNVLCWEGYTDESFVKSFTQQYGTEVKSTFIGSNDELVAQLTGGGNFDLISPSVDTTKSLIDAKLVQPLDVSQIPNFRNAFTMFQNSESVRVGGQVYGVPMCWGLVPIIVDLDAVPNPANSWAALWDPAYRGKISAWDDVTSIYNTALVLGFSDVYHLTDAQLATVKTKMIEQRRLLKKYWATAGELTNLFANKEIVIGNSFGGFTLPELRAKGRNIKEYVPQEGATAWVDFWMVPTKSANLHTAQLFMNHVQDARIQAQINKVTGYAVTNEAAIAELPKETVEQYSLNDPTALGRLKFWQQVPNRQKYLDLLNEVKSA